jgi:hypothetical protein
VERRGGPIDSHGSAGARSDAERRGGPIDETVRLCYFKRGTTVIGVLTDRPPTSADVRRIVIAEGLCEVMMTESLEGLLVHPERLGR